MFLYVLHKVSFYFSLTALGATARDNESHFKIHSEKMYVKKKNCAAKQKQPRDKTQSKYSRVLA